MECVGAAVPLNIREKPDLASTWSGSPEPDTHRSSRGAGRGGLPRLSGSRCTWIRMAGELVSTIYLHLF